MESHVLFRAAAREYVRAQRRIVACGDTGSTVDCHVLTELAQCDELAQQVLAERLMLDKGWISRSVARLASEGLVERSPDQGDARRVRLSLTDSGRARAARLDQQLNEHVAALFSGVSPDQDAALAGFLSQVLARLRDLEGLGGCRGMPQLKFRAARGSDWPAIAALLTEAGLPVEDARAHLPNFQVGIGTQGLVAAGGYEHLGEVALLRSFVVAPEARRHGCGGALLAAILSQAAASRVADVYLLTQTAAAFFERHGFEAIERSAAPDVIRRTNEFTQLCPASAVLMRRRQTRPDTMKHSRPAIQQGRSVSGE